MSQGEGISFLILIIKIEIDLEIIEEEENIYTIGIIFKKNSYIYILI